MPGKLITIVLLSAFAAPAEQREIVIHIRDKADLSPGVVKRAMNEVVDIFTLEGFTVRWSECGNAQTDPCPASTDYLVCIRLDHGTQKLDKVALGYALLSVGRGNHAVVMWPDVVDTAVRNAASKEMILGYTIAHELGHLITHGRHHDRGVMKPLWTDRDIKAMSQRGIRFTPDYVLGMKESLTDFQTASVKR